MRASNRNANHGYGQNLIEEDELRRIVPNFPPPRDVRAKQEAAGKQDRGTQTTAQAIGHEVIGPTLEHPPAWIGCKP